MDYPANETRSAVRRPKSVLLVDTRAGVVESGVRDGSRPPATGLVGAGFAVVPSCLDKYRASRAAAGALKKVSANTPRNPKTTLWAAHAGDLAVNSIW